MSKGMTLALIGVSNGAIQFMTYEELKKWRVELRRKRLGGDHVSEEEVKKLVSYHLSVSHCERCDSLMT